jgi:hypothetical protein
MSLDAVGFVGLLAFQAATAEAKAPLGGAGRAITARGVDRQTNVASNRNTNFKTITKLINKPAIKPIFTTMPYRLEGLKNGGKVFGQLPFGGPSRGHGLVVLPKPTPVTWGGNPPRAPQHGCDHNHDHHCDRGFFTDICYWNFWGFTSDCAYDCDYDFCCQ